MNLEMYDRSRVFGKIVGALGGPALRLAIAIDRQFSKIPAAQFLALALGNILPRITERYTAIDFLLPDVTTCIPRTPAVNFGAYLVQHSNQICPWGQFQASADQCTPEYDFALIIGDRAAVSAKRVLHVMSSGWRCFARYGQTGVAPSSVFNPFSCLATAALAAMMVYREAEAIEELTIETEVNGWSLFNYETSTDDGPALPEVVDVGQVFQAGLGGTGNSLLWGLRYGPELRGSWAAYENEALDITNNNRYLFMKAADAVLRKCQLAEREFKGIHPQLDFQAIDRSVHEAYRDVFHADLVLATVDDPQIRVELQRNGAAALLNVGTNTQFLSMSRHVLAEIRNGAPCVECFYGTPERMERRQRESTVSFVIGLLGAALGGEFVKKYTFPNSTLSNSWLANIFSATSGRMFPRPAVPGCFSCSGMKGGPDE